MAEKGGLTLEELQNISDLESEGNREKYFGYPEEELLAVLQEAIKNKEFKIARFLSGVLENNKNTKGQLTTTLNSEDKAKDTTTPKPEETGNEVEPKEKDQEGESGEIDKEFVKTNGEYVNLYKDQEKALKRINKYNEENGIYSGTIRPLHICVGYNEGRHIKTLVANYGKGPRAFKVINEESGELEEIELIPHKMEENDRIRNVEEVGDFWQIEVVRPDKEDKDNLRGEVLHYIVDKDFNEVPELGEQTGNGTLTKNKFGSYVYCRDNGEEKKSYTIFNENMEEIASFKNDETISHNITYCDNNICVCKVIEGGLVQHKVFKGNKVIFEGTAEDLENKLGGETYMEVYFYRSAKEDTKRSKENSRMSLPIETRFKDISQCTIEYNNEEKSSISIVFNGKKTIFKLNDVKTCIGTCSGHIPVITTENGDRYKVTNWDEKNNILVIVSKNERIFINKTTGDKLVIDREYGFQEGRLIKRFYNGNDCEIYDQDLNYLGVYEAGLPYNHTGYEKIGFLPVKRTNEGGKEEYYIVSTRTGKEITKFIRVPRDNSRFEPYHHYIKTTAGKTYLICSIPADNEEGATLAQVEI